MIAIDIHKKLNAASGSLELRINEKINGNCITAIYGASGAGKTTFLRILAGLMNPDKGSILVNNEQWFNHSTRINLKPQNRKIGFVFQDYALFPNMSVYQNLAFASPGKADSDRINKLIEITELGNLKSHYPATLSGGQKQRVALARALVQDPEILLLDEPLSALDVKTRIKLQDYILAVQQEFALTTIIVSHDIGEVVKLCDHVIELNNGVVKRTGTPSELFINKDLSGKLQLQGEVLKIEKHDIVYMVTVSIHNNIIRVIATESESERLNIGDKVIVASKAFNPIIYKIEL